MVAGLARVGGMVCSVGSRLVLASSCNKKMGIKVCFVRTSLFKH